MDASTVEQMVSSTFTAQDAQAEVIVDGAGAKYDITVVSDLFSDQRPVKRQQSVYAALRDAIADGRIHAVNIHAFTRDEWSSRSA